MTTRIEVRRGYFNTTDLGVFLASARDCVELLWWLLMCDSGLRIGEMRSLCWADLDGDSLRVKGKGNKWRNVPLTSRTREQIRKVRCLQKPRPTDKLCPVTSRAVQSRFQRCLRNSGLPRKNRCPHSLRHSFATSCLVAGIDIHRVGVLLGHSNTLTTTGYLHTDPKGLREAALKLDKLYTEGDYEKGQEGTSGEGNI